MPLTPRWPTACESSPAVASCSTSEPAALPEEKTDRLRTIVRESSGRQLLTIYGWCRLGAEIGRGPSSVAYECFEQPGERRGVLKLMPWPQASDFPRWQRGVQGRAVGQVRHEGTACFFVVQDWSEGLSQPLSVEEARDFVEFSVRTLKKYNAENYRHGHLCPNNLRRNEKGWEFADGGLHSPSGANFPLPDHGADDFATWLHSVRSLRLCERNAQVQAWLDEAGLTLNRLHSRLTGEPEPGWQPPAPGLRQWSDKLNFLCPIGSPSCLALPPGHTRFAAVANAYGEVFMVDLERGESRLLPFKVGKAKELALSDDGQWLAVATDKEVELWSLAGAQRQGSLPGQEVVRMTFSSQGRLLTAGKVLSCRWDLSDRPPETRQTFHQFVLYVGEAGSFGARSGTGFEFHSWDGASSWQKPAKLALYPFAGDWSPDYWSWYGPPPEFDGVPTGWEGYSLYRVDHECRVLSGNGEAVREIRIHPDTGLMVASVADSLRLWDRSGAALGRCPLARGAEPRSLRWSPSGEELFFLAGGSLLGLTREALLAGLKPVLVALEVGEPQSFSLPPHALLTGDANHLVRLDGNRLEVLQLPDLQSLWSLELTEALERLAVSRDGQQVLAATAQGVLRLDASGVQTLPDCPGGACALALEGLVWAALWPDGHLRCGSHRFDRPQRGEGLALSADGRQLIVYGDHKLQLIDTQTWQGLHRVHYYCDTPPQVAHLRSQPPTYLRTTTNNLIWREIVDENTAATVPLPSLRGVDPEGHYIVAQDQAGLLRLLDSTGLHELARLEVSFASQLQVGKDRITLVDAQGRGWIYPVQTFFCPLR